MPNHAGLRAERAPLAPTADAEFVRFTAIEVRDGSHVVLIIPPDGPLHHVPMGAARRLIEVLLAFE